MNRVSIIIPALNEREHIARAVDSAVASGAAEVIVADGGSQDGTVAVAESRGARVVDSPPGRAIQQNAGASAASGETLLFLHADNWLDPDAGPELSQRLAEERILFGAFRQRIAAEGVRYRVLEAGNSARVRLFGTAYGDQAIFVRRSAFEAVGGFPAAPIMEDLLLMRQLRKLGRPALLRGPVHVSARRWQRHGVVRQTLWNWSLVAAHRFGASPERLASFYVRHDVVE